MGQNTGEVHFKTAPAAAHLQGLLPVMACLTGLRGSMPKGATAAG
jgi:hypothetical protein